MACTGAYLGAPPLPHARTSACTPARTLGGAFCTVRGVGHLASGAVQRAGTCAGVREGKCDQQQEGGALPRSRHVGAAQAGGGGSHPAAAAGYDRPRHTPRHALSPCRAISSAAAPSSR